MNNLRCTTMKAIKNQFVAPRNPAPTPYYEISFQGNYKNNNFLSSSLQLPLSKNSFGAERHLESPKIYLNQSVSQVNSSFGLLMKQTPKKPQKQFLNSRIGDDQNRNQKKPFLCEAQKPWKQSIHCKSKQQMQFQPFNNPTQLDLARGQNCFGINLNNKFISSTMANHAHSSNFNKKPNPKNHQDISYSYSEYPLKHDLSCASTQELKQHTSKINFIQNKRKELIKDLCNQKENRGRKTVFNTPAFIKDKTQLILFETNKKNPLRKSICNSVPKDFKTYEAICYKRDSGIHKFLLEKEAEKNHERKQCISSQKGLRESSPFPQKITKNFFMKPKSKNTLQIPRVYEVGNQISLKIFSLQQKEEYVNIKILKKLADNGPSSTYLVVQKMTGFLYCLKKSQVKQPLSKNKNQINQFPNYIDFLIRQSKIGMSLDHPFLIKTYCTLYDEKNIYQLMQFVQGSTLQNHNRQKKLVTNQNYYKIHNSLHDLSHIRQILQELVQAVMYLHNKGIVHRDIKPANIFISNSHAFKIGDFGCSIYDDPEDYVGTLDYAAPEIMLHEKHGQPVDMWAIGCIAYELYTGNPPFYNQSREITVQNIIQCQYNLEKIRDEKFKYFVKNLLEKNPMKRFSAKEALQHSFIVENRKKHQA